MTVPFLDLVSQQEEIADEVLPEWERIFRSSAFMGGEPVARFEQAFADYSGAAYCVGVGNGTDAIELALRGAGLAAGGEVIIPANTFIATAEAVSRAGLVPVLVDCDDEYLLMDPLAIEAAITPRTQAIIPVHLYGQLAPMDAIMPIAERHGLAVIEDNAQAQGASSSFGRAGSIGLAAATSFYPGKNLGAAGDAGAVTTSSAEVADAIREIGAHGSRVKYVHDRIGVNSRLDALQAAFLSAKLGRLEAWNERRRVAANYYAELLASVQGVDAPKTRPGNVDVWHLYVVRLDERETVSSALAADGISTAIHYPTPVHRTGAYRGTATANGEFPVADSTSARILSLPMFPHITRDQQEQVVEALARAVSK